MTSKLSFTLREAAQTTGLSARFLWYAIADGRLKSIKVGGRRLILGRHLEDFIVRGGNVAENTAPMQQDKER